jgi:C4-dicarboxylate-specific signal transduction histidine kinase
MNSSTLTLSPLSPLNHNRRILIVDDNPAIHADFKKILCPNHAADPEVANLENILFAEPTSPSGLLPYELETAYQGQDALDLVHQSIIDLQPFALAFVDVRMPPGWDGIETVSRLWSIDPSLQIVVCTAYSDYSWNEMRSRLTHPESLVVLKKPFDNVEVQQLAHALTRKWDLNLQARTALVQMESMVHDLRQALGHRLPLSASSIGSQSFAPSAAHHHPLAEVLHHLRETLLFTFQQLQDTELQLVQAEKLASLGRLSAGIMHEINNPLNYALTAIALFHRHANDIPQERRPDFQETVQDVRDALLRIAGIVKDLKGFAHPNKGANAPIPAKHSLKVALRMLAAELDLRVHVQDDIPEDFLVPAVDHRLTQVFLNLIQNALDALATKSFPKPNLPSLHFSASIQNGQRTISIEDNGPGIPPEHLPKIFEPFFTTREVGQGTGLGLSICYRLLREMNAEIHVHSVPNTSTRFTLVFPDLPPLPP